MFLSDVGVLSNEKHGFSEAKKPWYMKKILAKKNMANSGGARSPLDNKNGAGICSFCEAKKLDLGALRYTETGAMYERILSDFVIGKYPLSYFILLL
jgi:hypothetical protein